jgi:hypothetical protein
VDIFSEHAGRRRNKGICLFVILTPLSRDCIAWFSQIKVSKLSIQNTQKSQHHPGTLFYRHNLKHCYKHNLLEKNQSRFNRNMMNLIIFS